MALSAFLFGQNPTLLLAGFLLGLLLNALFTGVSSLPLVKSRFLWVSLPRPKAGPGRVRILILSCLSSHPLEGLARVVLP
jgi:hypothetical protein